MIQLDLSDILPDNEIIIAPDETSRQPVMLCRKTENIYRRAFSELQLYKIIPMPLQEGFSYNFLTNGNIDSLSYAKFIVDHYKLDYLLFSTWCMATDDVLQIAEWLNSGRVKKIDAYLGEIFPGRYSAEYKLLTEIIPKFGGAVKVFRNHSKIYAGYNAAQNFYFGIQTSANISTNPRCENACITISKDIYEFYFNFYSQIKDVNNG